MKAFERILQLGFQDDHELMLQVGRSLFREGLIAPAHRFFDLAAAAHPDSPMPPPAWAMPRTGWGTTPARSTGCAARSSWSRDSPKRASTSPTSSTIGARARRPSTTSSAPSPKTTSTSSASGATSSQIGLSPARRGPRAQAVAHPAGRGGRRSRSDRHAAGRSRSLAGGRRHPRSASAGVFGTLLSELHAMQRSRATATRTSSSPCRASPSGATGRRSCCR